MTLQTLTIGERNSSCGPSVNSKNSPPRPKGGWRTANGPDSPAVRPEEGRVSLFAFPDSPAVRPEEGRVSLFAFPEEGRVSLFAFSLFAFPSHFLAETSGRFSSPNRQHRRAAGHRAGQASASADLRQVPTWRRNRPAQSRRVVSSREGRRDGENGREQPRPVSLRHRIVIGVVVGLRVPASPFGSGCRHRLCSTAPRRVGSFSLV
jgi:hypothetical protein